MTANRTRDRRIRSSAAAVLATLALVGGAAAIGTHAAAAPEAAAS